jgi:hypothetical protein
MMGYSPSATQMPVIYDCKLGKSTKPVSGKYLLGNFFQVPDHEIVALRVVKYREAPWVFESYEV